MLTAGMVDRGGVDISLETAACKIFSSELANRAANDAMQIAGGIGYSKEYPYERAVRDSRIMLIFEGTNEVLRALVALMALQQPGERLKALGKSFRDPIHAIGAIGSYVAGRAKRQVAKPQFTRVHPALADEAGSVASIIHSLGVAVESVLRKYGKEVIERQFLQQRFANVAIDVYLSVAVLSRTTWELERAGSEDAAAAALDGFDIVLATRERTPFPRSLIDRRPALRMFGGDFIFSVTRDFVRACTVPMLLMPGNDVVHAANVSADIAGAPDVEVLEPWKGLELRQAAMQRVREFLVEHTP
jgi:acyl-CoA dehydrogenase family protein 9